MTPTVLVLLRLAAALAADACDAPRDVLDLPVVDLRDAPAAAGAALLAAFRGAGAAAVVGHGVEVGAALRAGAALFRDAGPGERARLAARGGGTRQRGFLPRGSEAGAAGAFEAKEGFAWGASGAAWPAMLLPLPGHWLPSLAARSCATSALPDMNPVDTTQSNMRE